MKLFIIGSFMGFNLMRVTNSLIHNQLHSDWVRFWPIISFKAGNIPASVYTLAQWLIIRINLSLCFLLEANFSSAVAQFIPLWSSQKLIRNHCLIWKKSNVNGKFFVYYLPFLSYLFLTSFVSFLFFPT
jgi:uncharacterized membrane protein YoaK (UPF0700 family)